MRAPSHQMSDPLLAKAHTENTLQRTSRSRRVASIYVNLDETDVSACCLSRTSRSGKLIAHQQTKWRGPGVAVTMKFRRQAMSDGSEGSNITFVASPVITE